MKMIPVMTGVSAISLFWALGPLMAKPIPEGKEKELDLCGLYEGRRGPDLIYRVSIYRTPAGDLMADWHSWEDGDVLRYRGLIVQKGEVYVETYDRSVAQQWCGPWTWNVTGTNPVTMDDKKSQYGNGWSLKRIVKADF